MTTAAPVALLATHCSAAILQRGTDRQDVERQGATGGIGTVRVRNPCRLSVCALVGWPRWAREAPWIAVARATVRGGPRVA